MAFNSENPIAGRVIFAAALASTLATLGYDISKIMDWCELHTPAFVGLVLWHIGNATLAYLGGVKMPAGPPTDRPAGILPAASSSERRRFDDASTGGIDPVAGQNMTATGPGSITVKQ